MPLPAFPNTFRFYSWRIADTEARNTFPLPEIIFDPSLILSPHVALLGLILADEAFLAPNLTSAEVAGGEEDNNRNSSITLPLEFGGK